MRVTSRRTAIVSLAVVALLLAACKNVGSGSSEPSTGAEAVAIGSAQTDAGEALTGADGMTLYIFTADTDGTSTCSGSCAESWPPLLGGEATAGDGVSGTFGTTTRDDGSTQITVDGQPLYYYSGDSAAGDSNGDNVGGVWFIAPATGAAAETGEPQSVGERPSATPYRNPGS